MKMKRRFCSLSFGNRGFVLTLDAALAAIVVIMLLSVAVFYVGKAEDKLSNLQTVRTGSDILTVLDNNGALASLDHDIILEELNAIIPPYYNMRIVMNGTFSPEGIIVETASEIAGDNFIGSGKRFVVVNNGFATAEYYIWSK